MADLSLEQVAKNLVKRVSFMVSTLRLKAASFAYLLAHLVVVNLLSCGWLLVWKRRLQVS